MRHKPRLDDNQQTIVRQLRSIGVSVASTAAVGGGLPDIICGYKGQNWLFEIKDGSKSPSRRRLTADEMTWHSSWRGQVNVIHGLDDALRLMGIHVEGLI